MIAKNAEFCKFFQKKENFLANRVYLIGIGKRAAFFNFAYKESYHERKSNGAHAAGKMGAGDNRQQLHLLQSNEE